MISINLCLALVGIAFILGMVGGAILARNCDAKKREGKW